LSAGYERRTGAEVLNDYTPRLASNIYIGIRTGYLEPENEKKLRDWAFIKEEGKEGKPTLVKNS
jgi:hypothetical protein